jgi:hypothetical protein
MGGIVETDYMNQHGVTFPDWDKKAKELGAPKDFFRWTEREFYWWKGMSPRWTIGKFNDMKIVLEVAKKQKEISKEIGARMNQRRTRITEK